MSEIPDDVMEAAREIRNSLQSSALWYDAATHSSEFDAKAADGIIAAALMAEREKAARIAERMLVFADTTSNADEAIAAAIRRGQG